MEHPPPPESGDQTTAGDLDAASTSPAVDAGTGSVDPVEALRVELESIASVPVSERVERFERANELLAAELASLDEV